jgi:hypothetical protein
MVSNLRPAAQASTNSALEDKMESMMKLIQKVQKDTSTLMSKFDKFQEQVEQNLSLMRDEFIKKIEEKDKEISNLKIEINTVKVKMNEIHGKLDDSKAADKRDCLVLSGRGIPQATTGENTADIVKELLQNKLNIQPSDVKITNAYRIGKRPQESAPDNRHILVKLAKHEMKVNIITACSKERPNFAANECLIPLRNTIFYVLRRLKKIYPQVTGCGTRDGKVFVYIKNEDNEPVKHIVNSKFKLQEICTMLETDMNEYVSQWPQ